MPVIIPKELPAFQTLFEEGANVAAQGEIKAEQEVLIINLMPTKVVTETQLLRLVSKSEIDFGVDFLRMSSHISKNTSQEHIDRFYKCFEEIKDKKYAAAIITGAPVEKLDFEQVDYWQELCEVMTWADKNVGSTLYVCWGAQAGLYYHYGINKYELEKKISGVYLHKVFRSEEPLMLGIPEEFWAPHSRYTAVDESALSENDHLEVLAGSQRCGSAFVASEDRSRVFITGHIEYDPDTLAREYNRDVLKGISPDVPENYFTNNDPSLAPCVAWHEFASTFYKNWLALACRLSAAAQ